MGPSPAPLVNLFMDKHLPPLAVASNLLKHPQGLAVSKVFGPDEMLRGLSLQTDGRSRTPQDDRSVQIISEEIRMKKYVKPTLTSLGLLRVVTQFSCNQPPVIFGERGY